MWEVYEPSAAWVSLRTPQKGYSVPKKPLLAIGLTSTPAGFRWVTP